MANIFTEFSLLVFKYWIVGLLAWIFSFIALLYIIKDKRRRKNIPVKTIAVIFIIFIFINYMDMVSTVRCASIFGSMEFEANPVLRIMFDLINWFSFPIMSFIGLGAVACMMIISFSSTEFSIFLKKKLSKKGFKNKRLVRIIMHIFWIIFWIANAVWYFFIPLNNLKIC